MFRYKGSPNTEKELTTNNEQISSGRIISVPLQQVCISGDDNILQILVPLSVIQNPPASNLQNGDVSSAHIVEDVSED